MAKTITAGMRTHLASEVTSLATGWKITRTDGQSYCFTTASEAVDIDIGDGGGSKTYSPAEGYSRSSIQTDAAGNVGNMTVLGILDSLQLDESELRRGLFDYSDVRIFTFNHQDLTDGVIKMLRGQFGEIVVTPSGYFTVELRDLTQVLSRVLGEAYSKDCRADLGDSRCRVPISPAVVQRSTNYILNSYVRVATAVGDDPYEDRIYICTTPGTTDAVEPVYDTTIGNPTTDGTAVFEAVNAWARAFVVASVSESRRVFTVTQLGPAVTYPTDWFTFGQVSFGSGDNAGRAIEVRGFTAGDVSQTVELFDDLPFDIAVGDTGWINPGCDKQHSTCKTKFDNLLNMVAEPFVPSADVLQTYPDAQ